MKNKQISRTKRLIETDRLGFVSGSEELIRRDIESLLGEYFCLNAPIKLKLNKNVDKIEITVFAESTSVKRFNIVK